MAHEVPRARTTPALAQWRDALLNAALLLGVHLTESSLAVMHAQWALETGRGKACFCWNLGNKRHTTEETYCTIAAAWECSAEGAVPAGAKVISAPPGAVCAPGDVYYLPPAGAQRFAAFASIEEGARAYLTFLLRPSYARAWAEVLRGDAGAFAAVLKQLGYYTASAIAYAQGLRSLVVEYYRDVSAIAKPTPAPTVASPAVPAREPQPSFDNQPANPLGWETRESWDYDQGLFRELAASLVCSTCEDPEELPEAA